MTNTATSGGGIYAVNTLALTIHEDSVFANCTCQRTQALDSLEPFVANGGALYVSMTIFRSDSKFALARPTVSQTQFLNNQVLEGGAGGAIYWSVIPGLFDRIRSDGGLVLLSGYDDTENAPLAYGNKAAHGGDFIASGEMSLVVVYGPSKFSGATTTSEAFIIAS